MSTDATPPKPPPSSWASPLGIIALFLTATESVTGLAVTRATGGVQVALTVYVIALPLLVLALFGAILWTRPFVLYPPDAFGGGGASLKDFVEAMQRRYEGVLARREHDEAKIQTIVRTALEEAVAPAADAAQQARSPSAGRSRLADAVLARVDAQMLTIDTSPLGTPGKVRKIPFDPDLTVGQLLDDLYFSIAGQVAPSSYGTQWVLQDAADNRFFFDMGRRWAAGRGKPSDDRKVGEVGLRPGMWLLVIRPPLP